MDSMTLGTEDTTISPTGLIMTTIIHRRILPGMQKKNLCTCE